MQIRKKLIRLAGLSGVVYLLATAPALAMAEIERREMRRPAIVQTIAIRQRRRALDRRYGFQPVIYRMIA